MATFNRILVGMDLTAMDQQLLDHLAFFSKGAPKLYFLHVAYVRQMPVLVGDRYTRQLEDLPVNQKSLDDLQEEVRARIQPSYFQAEFHVIEGTITRQLLSYANEHAVDLTIMGRKKHPVGTGVASHRYLRGSEGSVLFVPELKIAKLERMVVATDFSDYSVAVVKKAIALLREQDPMPELHFVNVFDVPTDMAYRISRTETQFARIIRDNVEAVLPDYLARFDLSGIRHQTHLIENKHFNAAQHLVEFCKEAEADLLVIGARGHSVVSALLLGSVAERVLRYNEDTPLLVVRS